MESALVATKLHPPAFRLGLVERPRLLDRVRRGSGAKLTLVSAPAGFGKTTLLAAWLASRAEGRAAAWLSLDRADDEPTQFWAHLVAALQAVAPGLGSGLPASGEVQGEKLLGGLINELHARELAIDLVLDDYHVIERAEIHQGLDFLLERMPPGLHLVISTRADPPLALARLRVRGELVEIRSGDLRFTPEEAGTFLNTSMGLALAPGAVTSLTRRTEGWIAALQLAALSLEGREDAAAFVAGFAGDDRYVVDYLAEEVLQRQPEPIRRFLARTCMLERLSGPLCDAVTGGGGSGPMLEALVRANLFVVSLDARREWYRYHHLFADVLQTHFAAELADELPELHRRASDWFAAHGAPAEAIRHALAVPDFERAAALVERAIPAMRQGRQEATLRTWLAALPDTMVRARPVLGSGLAGVLMSVGAFEGVEDRLRDVEAAIAAAEAGAPDAVVVDRAQLPALPGAVELYRAALAQVRGDVTAVMLHAQRSIDLAPAGEHLSRAGAHGFLGIAHWTRGELEAAAQAWTACREGLRQAGHIADVFGASIALADINITLGRLRAATRVYEDALQLGAEDGHVLRGMADAHAGLGELFRLAGDRELAGQHLVRCQELGEAAGLPQFASRWRIAMAHLREAADDPEGALDLLDEAERTYVPDFYPQVRPIPAMKARILIRQGRLGEAERWRAEAGIAADDAPEYRREFEQVTLARLLLAQGAAGETVDLLDRLLEAAMTGGRLGSAIEILVLQAMALRATGDDASGPLQRALTLAEPEGFVQVFVDEGGPMAELLKAAARRGNTYARTLLGGMNGEGPAADHPLPGLIEPLSERELDVLRLLRSELDGPDIARQLGVSLNTLRTHTRNIYEKLGVNSRRAAVRQADELALLQRR